MCILCVLDLPILGLQYAQMRVPMHRAWPCIVHGVRCSGGPVRATQHAAMQAARSARARLTVGARVCRPAQGQWRLLLLSSVASLSSPPQSGQPGSLFPVEIGWSCAVRAACAMPGRWWPTSARPRRAAGPAPSSLRGVCGDAPVTHLSSAWRGPSAENNTRRTKSYSGSGRGCLCLESVGQMHLARSRRSMDNAAKMPDVSSVLRPGRGPLGILPTRSTHG